MSPLQTLGFTLGTSFASGLNLYATILSAGLLQRFSVITLPPSLQVLAHPVVLALALLLFVVEFVADKVPLVDSVWDAVHTFIRPPAAAILSYSAFGGVPEPWKIGAALLAGSVALTSHAAKASIGTPAPHRCRGGGAGGAGGAGDLEAVPVFPVRAAADPHSGGGERLSRPTGYAA